MQLTLKLFEFFCGVYVKSLYNMFQKSMVNVKKFIRQTDKVTEASENFVTLLLSFVVLRILRLFTIFQSHRDFEAGEVVRPRPLAPKANTLVKVVISIPNENSV